jgi:hypothetical protein
MKKNKYLSLSKITASVFLLFVVLRVFQVDPFTNLDWWWMSSPFWIPVVLVIGIFAACAMIVGTLQFFMKLFYGKPSKNKCK